MTKQLGGTSQKLSLLGNVFFFSLPFTSALTFDVGFPLKICEIVLIILVSSYIFFGGLKIQLSNITKILFAFFIWASLSVVINAFWKYDYPLKEFESRFGYLFDSISKLAYFALSIFAYFYTIKVFTRNEKAAIYAILSGAFLASLYSWYLLSAAIVGYPEFLLPGIKNPQIIFTSFGPVIRSGTFGEGNYLGLFLIFSSVLCFYCKKKSLGIYFLFSLIPTFSSIGILCAILFLATYYYNDLFSKRRMLTASMALFSICIGFLLLLSQPDFRQYFVSKFNYSNSEVSSRADGSRIDRLDSFVAGLEMSFQNPIIGVGFSNYGLHYDHFSKVTVMDYTGFKTIANNIYAEIAAETGIVGFILFCLFLLSLYKAAKNTQSRVLKIGIVIFLIYFMAYPTFTILYIWVFFGLIVSINNKKPDEYTGGY